MVLKPTNHAIRGRPINNRKKPMSLAIRVMNLETVHMDFVPKRHLGRRDTCGTVSPRFLTMRKPRISTISRPPKFLLERLLVSKIVPSQLDLDGRDCNEFCAEPVSPVRPASVLWGYRRRCPSHSALIAVDCRRLLKYC